LSNYFDLLLEHSVDVKTVDRSVQRVAERAEILHVGAEDDIAELRERKEDDEEHDGERDELRRRSVDCYCDDAHRLSEVEVFEQLHYVHARRHALE